MARFELVLDFQMFCHSGIDGDADVLDGFQDVWQEWDQTRPSQERKFFVKLKESNTWYIGVQEMVHGVKSALNLKSHTCPAATERVRSVTILPSSRSCDDKQTKSWNLSSFPNVTHWVSIFMISFVYILEYNMSFLVFYNCWWFCLIVKERVEWNVVIPAKLIRARQSSRWQHRNPVARYFPWRIKQIRKAVIPLRGIKSVRASSWRHVDWGVLTAGWQIEVWYALVEVRCHFEEEIPHEEIFSKESSRFVPSIRNQQSHQ